MGKEWDGKGGKEEFVLSFLLVQSIIESLLLL